MLEQLATRLTPAGRRRLRWAVPPAAAAVVAGVLVLPSTSATGTESLPPRTAAQLLADVATADVDALSGTVVSTSRLGLPELPSDTSRRTDPLALLTGSNTLRIWADGPTRGRVALLGQLAEYDAVRNGRTAWTYSSQQDVATRYVLPAAAADPDRAESVPSPERALPSPAAAAEAVLRAVDPTTRVSVDASTTVAGRPAYVLVLSPRDAGSLVASVQIAVDAETSTPLQLKVFSTQDRSQPAVEIGFTDISFERPDASVFDFSAPPGAEVKTVRVPDLGPSSTSATRKRAERAERRAERAARGAGSPVQVVGSGWASVAVLSGVDASVLAQLRARDSQGLLDSLSSRVPQGRLLSTPLLSVLFTDDGRVLAGAVPGETLQRAAAR